MFSGRFQCEIVNFQQIYSLKFKWNRFNHFLLSGAMKPRNRKNLSVSSHVEFRHKQTLTVTEKKIYMIYFTLYFESFIHNILLHSRNYYCKHFNKTYHFRLMCHYPKSVSAAKGLYFCINRSVMIELGKISLA